MRQQATVCLFLQLLFQLSLCTNIKMMIRMVHGSTVEFPCVSPESDFSEANVIWTFNGQNISASHQTLGSARVIKNGFYISISPVTAASEGEYVCVAKTNDVEAIRTYTLTAETLSSMIKVKGGSDVTLPCHFPPSSIINANAMWFMETSATERMKLNPEGDSTKEKKLDLLYPLDHDQSVILRDTNAEDSGVYSCESPEGERLHKVQLLVEAPPTRPTPTCTNEVLEPCKEEDSRTTEPILQESMGEFSMKLYSYLKDQNPSENLLFSPISINMILSHLLLGASGNTRRALETAICVPHDFHCVHSQMKKQREKMVHSLQMGSQIFYDSKMNLSESFTNQSIEYYEAEPTKLLETSEENTNMINQWVANKTRNKITHLLDEVPPGTQLILINAVSFSGQWKLKFREKVVKGQFIKQNGDLVKVPLLFHPKYMAAMMYVVELKAQVAKFDLTGGNSLYILLPHTNTKSDLQQVESRMTDGNVRHMIESLKAAVPQNIEVTLPRIKLNVEPNMIELIKKLGLSSLFEGASLCGLNPEGEMVLNGAKHKAFLSLTEQGVEASAATTLSFSRSFLTFSALRPFIMLLWNDNTNVPLFMGRVMEP